ncbi:MAG: hypothetical protein RL266_2191 [Bacteroidota bacterium]|jgi:hypothetical protein
MKPLFFLILFTFFSCQIFAQGIIQGISVHPSNPTVSDDIEIYVQLQFTSGSCEADDQGFGLNGATISAYAHHCVGMLTVICETADTFELGQLPAGNYTFDMSLSSGFGGPGCSPGIVVDDTEQFQFTVSPSVGIHEPTTADGFFYPNPVVDVMNFPSPLAQSATISNVAGQVVKLLSFGTQQVEMTDLNSGIYILHLGSQKVRILKF